jgi:2-iminobutanoate/2-iminopropanoate deaminase
MPGQPELPFSEAVQVGNMLYLSGQLGTDSTGRLVSGGIRAETRQALTNIEAALERRGFTLDQVVKCTVMLVDIGEWAAMNEVYLTSGAGREVGTRVHGCGQPARVAAT